MPKIEASPLFAVRAALLLFFGKAYILPTLLAVAIHELGHLTLARALGIKIQRLRLSLLGARMETDKELSYTDELLFALGGPLFGIIAAPAAALAAKSCTVQAIRELLLTLAAISFCLAILNLLPLPTLDGEKIISSLLFLLLPFTLADTVLRLCSTLAVFSLWIFAVYAILKTGGGIAMLVFCSALFAKRYILNRNNRRF